MLELRRKARALFPHSRRLAAKWVIAALKLRAQRGGFITEAHVAAPKWRAVV